MTDKVLCPWCGSEMHSVLEFIRGKSGKDIAWNCHMQCTNWECQAEGPFMQIPAYVEKEEADKKIRAATLHRCEPPIKPMTLEEVLTVSLYEGNIVWLEYRDERAERCGYNGFYEPQLIAAHTVLGDYKDEVTFYPTGAEIERTPDPAVYNIGWRCWSRKPTEQERKAYEWEGGRIEYPRLYSIVGREDEKNA